LPGFFLVADWRCNVAREQFSEEMDELTSGDEFDREYLFFRLYTPGWK
jgi:hypothetical protein